MLKKHCFLFAFGLCFSVASFAQNSPTEKTEPLKDSVDKYSKLGQYARVVPFAESWSVNLKKEKGESSAEYGAALNTLGDALIRSGKSNDAEPILLKGLEIRKKALGENHLDVAKSLNTLGFLNMVLGNNLPSEDFFLQSLEIRKNALGEAHLDVGASSNNLGQLYLKMRNYTRAEEYSLSALSIFKKNLGEENAKVATTMMVLGELYEEMGNYTKAEEIFLKALSIWKGIVGETHPIVATAYMNLGELYWLMGNYPKTEEYYLNGLNIRIKNFGDESPLVASTYNYLGNLSISRGHFPKAKEIHEKALAMRTKAFGEDHRDVAISLLNLGNVYLQTGHYKKAEEYQLKSLAIFKKIKEDVPATSMLTFNLGLLQMDMGNYPQAKTYLMEAFEARRQLVGPNHPLIQPSYQSLGEYYRQTNSLELAEDYYTKSWDNLVHQIQNYFPFLSDAEKAKFYETIGGDMDRIKSFYLSPGKKASPKTIALYNQQLYTKALLLSTSARWKQRIKTSGDKKLFALYTQWETVQNQISKLYGETDSTLRAGLAITIALSEKLEKELSKRSEAYGKMADRKMVNWQDIQASLKPGEAAIEMLRVKKWGTAKVVTDTSDLKKPKYKVLGLTDTIQYAALIVKPGLKQPELVLLSDGNDMEGKRLTYYKNAIKNKLKDEKSFQVFWEKIGTKLGPGVKTIYFSPEGIYHGINLNTLWNPATKKYLLEEKDIRIVTSTKDILLPKNTEELNKLAYLFGYPNYNTSISKRIEMASTQRSSPELSYLLPKTRGEGFAELPGTKEEVESISKLLTDKGWEVQTLEGNHALEETLKESLKPRVLHLATHGFFLPDTTNGTNPLLHSGLLLTGANKTFAGEKSEDAEDGILTAYEAMNLNLDNTDLVVLSACETGLGEIKNGEGVYGLQRAFKVAGAKTIIMSLWKVSDQATQELMVSFYKNWLGPPAPEGGVKQPLTPLRLGGRSGGVKRDAFLAAQKELKAKYPDPYYWGAFVMVGE